ncbi:hypothetical protein FCS21_13365 [Colwellia ponticola]|uniref:DUF4402 domain-containing protein n=2 Tax=Colwellia ponticola TaxID=2304625 RepID=A0A8H2JJC8_9GAMM|nr:hypothetical protein FCS21_13365 [Colwellia ponticola]
MIFMKNRIASTMTITSLSVAAMLFTPATVFAESITANASVTVQNSFTLAETTPLSFGTVVAIANDNTAPDLATLVVSATSGTADVATQGTVASLVAISPGTPATFTVSGAAPNTVLTITDASAFQLTDPSSTDTKVFDVSNFTKTVVTSGTPFTYDTDATGTLVFNYGATLSTSTPSGGAASDNAIAYDNVTFTGTYTMQVEY